MKKKHDMRWKLKKMVSFVLSVMMAFSMAGISGAGTAYAAEKEGTQDGSASEDVQTDATLKETTDEQNEATDSAEKETEWVEITETLDDDDLPDSDELFAEYVDRVFYEDYSIATLANYGEKYLDDKTVILYRELKEQIAAIANGDLSNTVITVDTSSYLTWTANELGTTSVTEGKKIIDEKANAILNDMLLCLVVDCPYELYWFNKTLGCRYATAYATTSSGDLSSYRISTMEFTFYVSESYQDGNNTTVDTTRSAAAKNAAANAQDIAAKYTSLTDHEKAEKYKEEICDLVSYDYAAADGDVAYGDPWQLIYVFDEDPDTNVVCEGYSKAFQYLCDIGMASATSYIATGDLDGGTGAGLHMWNLLDLNGCMYMIDVTNSDSGTVGQNGGLFLVDESDATSCEEGIKYVFTINNRAISYVYDDNTIKLYPKSIRTLGTINIADMVDITNEPSDLTLTYGYTSGKALSVTASAQEGTLSYQWYEKDENGNGIAITGATGASYTIPTGLFAGTKTYYCVVTNTFTGGSSSATTRDVTVTINKKELTPSVSGTPSKTYDGTTAASGLTISLSGTVSDDDVSASASFSYADKNVGTNITITATGITLTGKDTSNYTLSNDTATGAGTITAKEVTPVVDGTTEKVYDGTAIASGMPVTLTGVISGDDVTASAKDFSYADKNVGTNIVVTASGITLSGADAGNYVLFTDTATGTGTITAKEITPVISGTASKTYDGTMDADGLSVTLNGVITGDNVSAYAAGFAYADKNVGTDITVSASGITLSGADAANYALSKDTAETTGTITAKTLARSMISGVEDTYYYTGSAIEPAVTASDIVNGKELISSNDYTVSYTDNTNTGAATVIVTGKGNYTGTVTLGFDIQYMGPPAQILYNGSALKEDWYADGVIVSADGYTVAEDGTGSYFDGYTINGSGTITAYLRFKQDKTGYITDICTVTVNIDDSAPSFKGDECGIEVKDVWYKTLLNVISFGRFFNDDAIDITITAEDSESGTDAYYYYIDTSGSESAKTAKELNAVSFTESKNGKVSVANEDKYTVYAYAKDNVGNESDYISSDGFVIDRTAPSITIDLIAVFNDGAGAEVTVNEEGTVYYVIKENEQEDITSKDIINDNTAGKFETESEGEYPLVFGGYKKGTTYYVYAVEVDRAGNISTVSSVSFVTLDKQAVVEEDPVISGTYGETVGEMGITPGTVTCDGDVVSGAWKITDKNSTDVPAVGTDKAYEVTFTPDDSNIPSVSISVIPDVAKRVVTVTAADKTKTYGEENPALTWSVTSGSLAGSDTVNELGVTLTTDATTGSNAGTYEITGTADSKNYEVTIIPGILTITKADGSGSVSISGWTYGEAANAPVATSDTNGADNVFYQYKEAGAADSAYTGNVPENAGEYTVRAIFAATVNYTEAEATADFTITKAKTALAAGEETYSKETNDSPFTISVDNPDSVSLTFTSDNENVAAVDGSGRVTIMGEGTAVIKISTNGDENHEPASIEVTINVTKAKETKAQITKDPSLSGTYGDTVSDMTLTAGTAVCNGAEITGTWTVTDNRGSDIPSVETKKEYEVTFTPDDKDIQPATVSVIPTVSKRGITIEIKDAEKVYGEKNPDFTWEITTGSLVKGDDTSTLGVDISTEAKTDSNAGEYEITGTADSANYDVTVIPGTLTITKADGSGNVSIDGWTYGEIANTPHATSDTNGTAYVTFQYKEAGAADSTYSDTVPKDAGGYTVKATFPETINYKEAEATADFTIAKAKTQISVNENIYSKETGDDPFTISVDNPDGATLTFKSDNENVAAVNTDGLVTIAGEGTAVVTIAVSGTGNYEAEPIKVTINVTKKDTEPVPAAVDKEALKAEIDADEELSEDKYTSQSWAVFYEALLHAREVYDDESAAQEEIEYALNTLISAREALEETKDSDTGTTGDTDNDTKDAGNGTDTGDDAGSTDNGTDKTDNTTGSVTSDTTNTTGATDTTSTTGTNTKDDAKSESTDSVAKSADTEDTGIKDSKASESDEEKGDGVDNPKTGDVGSGAVLMCIFAAALLAVAAVRHRKEKQKDI